jgi:drug/metabolite transporter (DMT)-like permease
MFHRCGLPCARGAAVTPAVVGLVLCAAILHATWNAILRGRADLLWSVTVMSFAATALAIPGALLLPPPASASWPYLGLSAGLQLGYSLCLVLAYRHAELGQVYPIVRGCVPLLVTLGAAVFAGERLSPVAIAGIALVSSGIMSLALGKGRPNLMSISAALATGLIIAAYTVTDGIGARLSGNPYAYVTWIFLLYGLLMPLAFVLVRRRLTVDFRAAETRIALTAGVVHAHHLRRRDLGLHAEPDRPGLGVARDQHRLCRADRSPVPRRTLDAAAARRLRGDRGRGVLPELASVTGQSNYVGSPSRFFLMLSTAALTPARCGSMASAASKALSAAASRSSAR